MKQRGKILERVVLGADLPAEPVPGLPIVEIAGEKRVLIENHHGVTAYGHNEICVRVCFGQLRICGNNLKLVCMTKHQLVISGQIESVSILRGMK